MSSPVEPGQVIKGKYRITRVLGAGGMGVVVEASHVALEQRFAIKFLLPAMLANREIVDRFAREARALSRLEGDHVARVTDVDALEDGTPFMVMEFLEGNDLSVVRKQRQALPAHVAVGFILEACEALVEAHAMGIVHRDLKPANLFLARRRDGKTRLKVLDFGISKLSGDADVSTTRTSVVMGSVEFMSPEQMLSTRDADARSDIWALGVTLYELLTTQPPFPGESLTQVCALVMSRPARPPSSLRPDVPPGLDAVVLRCLEKDRDARYSNVRELMAALAPFASPASASAPPDRASWVSPVAQAGTALLPPSDPSLRTPSDPSARPVSQPFAGSSQPFAGPARGTSDPYARPTSDPYARPPSTHPAPASTPPTPHLAGGTGQLAPISGVTPGPATGVPVSTGTVAPPPRRSMAPVFVGGAALVLIGGLAVLMWTHGRPSDASPAGTAHAASSASNSPPPASAPAPSASAVVVAPVAEPTTTATATPSGSSTAEAEATARPGKKHHTVAASPASPVARPAVTATQPKKDMYGDR